MIREETEEERRKTYGNLRIPADDDGMMAALRDVYSNVCPSDLAGWNFRARKSTTVEMDMNGVWQKKKNNKRTGMW
jgi:hypothetical protein